jgi:hypothetical protein
MKRRVQPELLDSRPPEDPRAIGSRRDLCRINWWMGSHRIMWRALQENLSAHAPGRIVEIGSGDGNFLLSVARKYSPPWPQLRAGLLDRQACVSAATLRDFAGLGWQVESMVADVFDWPPGPEPVAAVLANLFLHHFEEAALARLLWQISQRTSLFIAIEPHRFLRPWLCGQLLRVIGCNAVTRHDGEVSVRAGFVGGEISALWPDTTNWRLTERRAGCFSHLFVAQRIP